MTERKPGSGGKRENAGRKTKGDNPKIPISLRLDSEVVNIIKSQPNQTEFIESAVREKHKRDFKKSAR